MIKPFKLAWVDNDCNSAPKKSESRTFLQSPRTTRLVEIRSQPTLTYTASGLSKGER